MKKNKVKHYLDMVIRWKKFILTIELSKQN